MTYRVCLYDILGGVVGPVVQCWTATAAHFHQRGPFDFYCNFHLRECIQLQVEATMREAIARLIIDLNSDPVVKEWQTRLSAAR